MSRYPGNVTRLAYIWVFFTIALALLLHSCQESNRRTAVIEATVTGLSLGIRAGCEENNDMRRQIWRTAQSLHPLETREEIRKGLRPQNCNREARKVVRLYLRRARE